MSDYIIRATAGDGMVRAFAATTKDTVNEAIRLHGNLSPVAATGLGRLLTGTAIMGSMLKNDSDILTVTMKGDGPMGGITVTSDSHANVRGYVNNPEVMVPLKENGKLDVGGALGMGTISVVRDMGLKEPVMGQVPLVSGEVADDLTYYYAKSEQVPSCVSLGVLLDKEDGAARQAGGFIIQMMPGATEDIIRPLEEKLPYLKSVTALLDEGLTPRDILAQLLGDCNLKIHEELPVKYYCNCSREKVEKALLSVGLKELEDILREDGQANIHCHFCNKDYGFDKGELNALIQGLEGQK